MDNITGSYSFEKAGEVLHGQIRNVPFSKGSMKSVYNVRVQYLIIILSLQCY